MGLDPVRIIMRHLRYFIAALLLFTSGSLAEPLEAEKLDDTILNKAHFVEIAGQRYFLVRAPERISLRKVGDVVEQYLFDDGLRLLHALDCKGLKEKKIPCPPSAQDTVSNMLINLIGSRILTVDAEIKDQAPVTDITGQLKHVNGN